MTDHLQSRYVQYTNYHENLEVLNLELLGHQTKIYQDKLNFLDFRGGKSKSHALIVKQV